MESIIRIALTFTILAFCVNIIAQPIDTIPPTLNSINFSPNPVNVEDSINLQLNVTDNISGVDWIQVDIVNADTNQYQFISASIDDFASEGSNDYSKKFKINPWAKGGQWHVQSLFIHDKAMNILYQDDSASAIATFAVISSTPDTTAPQLNNVYFEPGSVNNGDSITVFINTEDILSGIDNIQVDIVNPIGEQRTYLSKSVSDWAVPGTNLYSNKLKISDYAINGEWYVSDLFIHDNAGNMLYLSDSLPSIASFNVTSDSPDGTAPVLNYFNVEPQQGVLFPTQFQGDALYITMGVEDDLSGIDKFQVDIVNPYGGQEISTSTISIDSCWITGNNEYTRLWPIFNEFAISGEWYVSSLYIYDRAGNLLFLDGADTTLATFYVSGVGEP